MQNPFESGDIKNYILLYVGVVVIMILFFIASTLFNDVQKQKKKVFDKTEKTSLHVEKKTEDKRDEKLGYEIKLLDRSY